MRRTFRIVPTLLLALAPLAVCADDAASLAKTAADRTKSAKVRGAALEQLIALGPGAKAATPDLIGLLQDGNPLIRDYAITCLAAIGPAARPAVQGLAAVAEGDPEPELRRLAKEAMDKLSGVSAPPAPAPRAAAPAKPATGTAVVRPAMVWTTGRYFRWAAPAGWTSEEGTNGVTVTSPDGRMLATSAMLLRSPGSSAPQAFLLGVLPLAGTKNVKVLSAADQPDIAEPVTGMTWKVREIDLAATPSDGREVKARYTVGVVNRYGVSYDALVVGFHTPPGDFDGAANWLTHVAQSISVVNARGVAGNDTLIPVRNHPLDNSGLIESWRQKGLSEDRIAKGQREGMMGYERMQDSSTGATYDMPLESYDAGRGGYVNPVRPTELLDPADPGQ